MYRRSIKFYHQQKLPRMAVGSLNPYEGAIFTFMKQIVWLPMLVLIGFGCSKKSDETTIKELSYTVVNSFPHDTTAFTEGFLIHQGQLYESTGDKESWIGVIDIKTGRATRKVEIDKKYFGEGMTILGNKVYQLTWKHHTGFVYDFSTFREVRQFSYPTEGWGMTTDGKDLIMSDGTDKLYFLDSASLTTVKTLSVTQNGQKVNALNELEFINGSIFANVWQTSTILRIDASTGVVTGVLELSELTRLARQIKPQVDVLNGIAWHPQTKLLLVTGKFWPIIYVLKMKEA